MASASNTMLGQAPRVGVERSALRADPDLSAHLNNLAASFASQYSPLEFIVKALVLRLSTVEHTVGIGLDDASGPSMVERLEALENKVSNLAHNIQGFDAEEETDIFGNVVPYSRPPSTRSSRPPSSGLQAVGLQASSGLHHAAGLHHPVAGLNPAAMAAGLSPQQQHHVQYAQPHQQQTLQQTLLPQQPHVAQPLLQQPHLAAMAPPSLPTGSLAHAPIGRGESVGTELATTAPNAPSTSAAYGHLPGSGAGTGTGTGIGIGIGIGAGPGAAMNVALPYSQAGGVLQRGGGVQAVAGTPTAHSGPTGGVAQATMAPAPPVMGAHPGPSSVVGDPPQQTPSRAAAPNSNQSVTALHAGRHTAGVVAQPYVAQPYAPPTTQAQAGAPPNVGAAATAGGSTATATPQHTTTTSPLAAPQSAPAPPAGTPAALTAAAGGTPSATRGVEGGEAAAAPMHFLGEDDTEVLASLEALNPLERQQTELALADAAAEMEIAETRARLTAKQGESRQRALEAQARARETMARTKAQEALRDAEHKMEAVAAAGENSNSGGSASSAADREALRAAAQESRRQAAILTQMAERERRNRMRAQSRRELAREASTQAARSAAAEVAAAMEEKLAEATRLIHELGAAHGVHKQELALARAQALAAQNAANAARSQAARLRQAEMELARHKKLMASTAHDTSSALAAQRQELERTKRQLQHLKRRRLRKQNNKKHQAAAVREEKEGDDDAAATDLVDAAVFMESSSDDDEEAEGGQEGEEAKAGAAAAETHAGDQGTPDVATVLLKQGFADAKHAKSTAEYSRVLDDLAVKAASSHNLLRSFSGAHVGGGESKSGAQARQVAGKKPQGVMVMDIDKYLNDNEVDLVDEPEQAAAAPAGDAAFEPDIAQLEADYARLQNQLVSRGSRFNIGSSSPKGGANTMFAQPPLTSSSGPMGVPVGTAKPRTPSSRPPRQFRDIGAVKVARNKWRVSEIAYRRWMWVRKRILTLLRFRPKDIARQRLKRKDTISERLNRLESAKLGLMKDLYKQISTIKEAVFPKGRNRLHHGTPQSISEVAEDLGSLTREFRTTKRETSGRIDKVHAKVKVVEGFIKGNAEFVAEVKKLAADSQALATAGTEARKLLTEGASRRDARISALENSATDTTASTAALKKQMAQERDLRAASMTDFRDRVDAAVAQVQSLREQLLTTAVPEGGAVGMVALQENSEALLAEVQELLQDQLSIRDEALQILQQRVQQAEERAEDSERQAAMLHAQTEKAITGFSSALSVLQKEVRAVKVVMEGKTDLRDVEESVTRGLAAVPTREEMDNKADRAWVSDMVEALAVVVRKIEEDSEALQALESLRKELDSRTQNMADRHYVSQLFGRLEVTMDNFQNRQDFIAHMNVLKAILDTKAKREDLDAALASVTTQVQAMETGVLKPSLAKELADMRAQLKEKANKSDLLGFVLNSAQAAGGDTEVGLANAVATRKQSLVSPPIVPHGRGPDVLLTTVRCLSCNQPRLMRRSKRNPKLKEMSLHAPSTLPLPRLAAARPSPDGSQRELMHSFARSIPLPGGGGSGGGGGGGGGGSGSHAVGGANSNHSGGGSHHTHGEASSHGRSTTTMPAIDGATPPPVSVASTNGADGAVPAVDNSHGGGVLAATYPSRLGGAQLVSPMGGALHPGSAWSVPASAETSLTGTMMDAATAAAAAAAAAERQSSMFRPASVTIKPKPNTPMRGTHRAVRRTPASAPVSGAAGRHRKLGSKMGGGGAVHAAETRQKLHFPPATGSVVDMEVKGSVPQSKVPRISPGDQLKLPMKTATKPRVAQHERGAPAMTSLRVPSKGYPLRKIG